MMRLWLDTYAKSTTRTQSVALSVVAHVVLIGAAVAGTANTETATRDLPENSIVRFMAPPDREAGQQPQPEMVRYVAIAVPTVKLPPVVGGALQPPDKVKSVEEVVSGADERDARPLPELHGEDSVFSVVEVDSAATRYEWSAAPAYPPRMLAKGTEGRVRAEFIVSQEGYVDTMTLQIIETTNDDFTKAVRDALPFMRFKPAKIGKAIVSQLVLQEFRFQITKEQADSLKTRKPIP